MTTHALNPRERVPVEHRFLGLDRRTFLPAAIALVVWALWAWVMPSIDGRVAWDDPIRAGETIQVTEAVTMAPPTGWGVVSGLRTGDRTQSGRRAEQQVVLTHEGVVLQILTGDFTGTPARLLRQANLITTAVGRGEGFHVRSKARTTTTSTGVSGVLEGFESEQNAGVLAAFVLGGQGIEIQVVGTPAQMGEQAEQIGQMLDSLTYTPQGSSR